jgi:hypothetical protein
MLENAIKIAVDPFFPFPETSKKRQLVEHSFDNKFELIFNEALDMVGEQIPETEDESESDREIEACEVEP